MNTLIHTRTVRTTRPAAARHCPARRRRPATRPIVSARRATPLALAAALACLAAAVPQAHATNYVWATGSFVPGVTAPATLVAPDTLRINAGAGKVFNGVAFNNTATVTWNADLLGGGNSAQVSNAGLWLVASDTNTLQWQFGGQPSFINSGTLRKTAGALTSLGNWSFISNAGTAEAAVGTLSFNSGNPVFNDDSKFIGAGFVSIDTAALFNGSLSSQNLVFSSGSMTGNAALLKAGAGGPSLLRWSGGQLLGTWEVGAGQTFAGLDGGGKVLGAATWTNNGTTLWQTTQTLQGQNSGAWVNNSLFEVQADSTTQWVAGGQPSFINNASGVVRATNGATFQTGNFNWISNGGQFDAPAGSALVLNGGSLRFNANTRFTGAGSITLTQNARFVDRFESANLTLASGTATGGDGSTGSKALLSGKVAWSGGQLAGTWQIVSGKTLTGVAGSDKALNGSLTNSGNLKWATVEPLQGINSSSLINKKLFEASLTGQLLWAAGGQPTLTNTATGTVRATGGASFSLNNWNVVSDGGIFEARTGSALVYNGSNNTFNEGTQFIGTGRNSVTGTARFVGNVTSENLRLDSGSFVGGSGAPGSRGLLNGKTVWSGGDFGGLWTLPALQTLNAASGTAAKRLNATDFVNAGTVLWATTTGLEGFNSAQWTNDGVFEATKSMGLTWVAGGQPTFTNGATGILRANKGATLTMNNFIFVSNASTLDAKANSTIDFTGGNATFNANTQFIGAGTVRVANTANFVGTQRSSNLLLAGGTLTGGSGALGSKGVLRGTTRWSSGDLAGTWQLDAGQSLATTGTGSRRINAGSFSNLGTITWATAEALQMFNSASFVNDGNLLLQEDASVLWVAGGQPTFTNNGLLRKTGGAGNSSLASLNLVNNGTLQVDTGTLTLPNGFTNGGVLAGSGTVSANPLTNGGTLSPGDFNAAMAASATPFGGSTSLDASTTTATLNLAGNYVQTSAGKLDLQVTNSSAFDKVLVSGNATLGGTLNVGCLGTCSFPAGAQLVLLDAGGTLSGSFSAINFFGLPAGSFNVTYDGPGGRVLLNVTAPVAAVRMGGAR